MPFIRIFRPLSPCQSVLLSDVLRSLNFAYDDGQQHKPLLSRLHTAESRLRRSGAHCLDEFSRIKPTNQLSKTTGSTLRLPWSAQLHPTRPAQHRPPAGAQIEVAVRSTCRNLTNGAVYAKRRITLFNVQQKIYYSTA